VSAREFCEGAGTPSGGSAAWSPPGPKSRLCRLSRAGAFSGMTIIAARSGGQAVASHQILLNLLAVVFMVALGVPSATTVLTGDAIGRGVTREAGRASWTGLAVNTGLMLLIGSVLFGFSQPMAAAYTADASLRVWVVRLMPLAGRHHTRRWRPGGGWCGLARPRRQLASHRQPRALIVDAALA
jgi:hypothetical protein